MKKIEFGYSNNMDSRGQWESIGINPYLTIIGADYCGAIEYDGNSYVVARVTEDDRKYYPALVGRLIVRPAIADLYPDGGGNIFLDLQESIDSTQIEEYLNQETIRRNINGVSDIIAVTRGISKAPRPFDYLSMDERFIATSIPHEAFEQRKEAIKRCHKSFSDLQMSYEDILGREKK